MATIITYSGGTISPELVDGYASARETRTIVHHVLGRTDPDVTLRPAGLRAGTLTLLFATAAAASAAETALRVPRVFTLSDSDLPEVGMSFVVADGELRASLDDESRRAWLVEVPFREVAP